MSSSPLNLLSQLFSGFGGWESSKDDSIALVCTSTGTTPKLLAWWARYHLGVGFGLVYIYVHETDARPGVFANVCREMARYRDATLEDESDDLSDEGNDVAAPDVSSEPFVVPLLGGAVHVFKALVSRVPRGAQIVTLQASGAVSVTARRMYLLTRARARAIARFVTSQEANAADALARARKAGASWMCHFDDDELLYVLPSVATLKDVFDEARADAPERSARASLFARSLSQFLFPAASQPPAPGSWNLRFDNLEVCAHLPWSRSRTPSERTRHRARRSANARTSTTRPTIISFTSVRSSCEWARMQTTPQSRPPMQTRDGKRRARTRPVRRPDSPSRDVCVTRAPL